MSGPRFKNVSYSLDNLVAFIDLGQIGLPDIQRPFIWKNAKVRDLFDSMYRGFPVGYLLLWQTAEHAKTIGVDGKQLTPSLLIVDGQQRLTSLYAVLKAKPIVRDNYETEFIEIAFNPVDEKFEVADAAIRKNRAFISNISTLWSSDTDLFDLADEYLESLASNREIPKDEASRIKNRINRLHSLTSFPFTALELASNIGEGQVAEIFVRINSMGTTLKQADFILTLMSVYWDEGRDELEQFCRQCRQPTTGTASPFNHYIVPDPDELLRVSVGLGFKRARLQYVYSILRGKDLETEQFSVERRDEQFGVLREAQKEALDLTNWHEFFTAINQAGFRGGRFISSNYNLIYSYVLYLIGKNEYGVDSHLLRRLIARWFFMSNITGRYTASPESALEYDLSRLRGVDDAAEFVSALNATCDANLTDDFWAITLPEKLASSAAWSPSLFAYYAALVLLDAKALFSTQKVVDLFDPSVHGKRSAAEKHHLFPKAYLESIGVKGMINTNQIANFAVCDWTDNAAIGDQPPLEYVPEIRERFSVPALADMHHWHALPDGWEELEYNEFLCQRRELMAQVIAEGYRKLSTLGTSDAEATMAPPVDALVATGESDYIEFKSTFRMNLHTGEKDPRMELAVLKTIAGFLNNSGGTLVIGIGDDGSACGLRTDGFSNEDRMNLHLVNLIRDHMSPHHMIYVHPRFEDFEDERVMAIECRPAKSPVWLKDGKVEHFYLRTGAATTELTPSQTQQFIKQRFNG